ncbi:MAG: ACT domain-containing protein, partial [Clostridia bacterium]|nr:ACT domain-containing protein [Clostridia bacterium]
ARDTLVDAPAMKEALAAGKVGCYVTDFPTEETVGVPGIIAIPHLGASTEESEDNCAMMAAAQLDDYLQNGNIKNSVNYPNASQEFENDFRICIAHRNVPGTLAKITTVLSGEGANIEHMLDKSKKDYAYSIVDTDSVPSDGALEAIRAMPEVIRVRLIRKDAN